MSASRRGGLVFALCFAAGLCEGYDLQCAGMAAPKFAPVFHLDPAHLGTVFAASTLGLFIGALAGGRAADTIGRRGVLIAALLVFGLFSIGTACVTTPGLLMLMRFLTGVGLGAAMPNLIALTAEAGKPESAGARITMLSSAMPFGGFLAGALMVARPDIDWKSVFWIGGLAPVAIAVPMLFALPESQVFRANQAARTRVDIGATLGTQGRIGVTLLMWAAAFFTSLALYLLINWLPSLLVGKGFLRADASKVAMVLTLGGAASGFAFAALMRVKQKGWLYAATWLGMILSVAGMAIPGHSLLPACITGFGCGFFLSGGGFLLYAQASALYPAAGRGTGVGFLVGVSRLGAVAGPLLAGWLLTADRTPGEVLLALVPLIGAALVAAVLATGQRTAIQTSPQPEGSLS